MPDKTAWVFGASGTLGRALVERLLRNEIRVVAFVNKKQIEDIPDELQSLLTVTALDLSSTFAVYNYLNSSFESLKEPNDIFFCARGKLMPDTQLTTSESIDQVLDDYQISFLSPFIVSQFSISKYSNLRTITFVSSQYALVGQNPCLYEIPDSAISSTYSASKSAVVAAARNLAITAAKKGVYVNTISLGGIRESAGEELVKKIESWIPSGRMISASDAADFLYSVSQQAPLGLVGSNLVLDMGWIIQ